MSSPETTSSDALSQSLERIEKGDLPRTPFELLHHQKASDIIAVAAAEALQSSNQLYGAIGESSVPMNAARVHWILTKGRGFLDKESEAAESIDWKMIAASVRRQINDCRKQVLYHPLPFLVKELPEVIKSLTNSWHPMTLAEMKIFEERTR